MATGWGAGEVGAAGGQPKAGQMRDAELWVEPKAGSMRDAERDGVKKRKIRARLRGKSAWETSLATHRPASRWGAMGASSPRC